MRELRITNHITNRDNDSLERFLKDIRKEDLLSPEEEADLAQKIKQGDQAALDKMVKANLRFVVSVANQYQRAGISREDLVEEGCIGLIHAAKHFDETRGLKFITYAVWWIRQSIELAIANQSNIVHVPQNQVGLINRMVKASQRFEQENERKPSNKELAQLLNVTEDKIEEAQKSNNKQFSLDAPISTGETGTLLDVVADKDMSDTDASLIEESLKEELEQVFECLNNRERLVMRAVFGLDDKPMTYEEIGEKLGFTRERVRQIKKVALRKLRKNSDNIILKSYLGK